MLHIDEEKQLQSPHGKTDCRQCHPDTVQFPHTGVTEVECNKTCHIDDREKIKALDPSYYTNFHKNERFAITRLDDESSCRICHPLYPHSENNKVRALVNMHTGFMLCEVCHLKKRNSAISYDWKEPEEFEFTGQPYGTHEKREIMDHEAPESMVTKMLKMFDQETKKEKKVTVKHFISRIAVYTNEGDKKSLFINTWDDDRAREFLAKEKEMGKEERKNELDFFHRDIAKKEISVACNECHSPKGILDFRKLGFSENKTKDLEYLNIKGLVTKYDTFVIPNLPVE